MARPQKLGLDYFPFDVSLFDDEKVQLLSSRFGVKGEIIYIRLLCKAYRTGYYYRWGEDEALLFAKSVGDGITHSLVNDVVQECIKRLLFDKRIFDAFKILTSQGIQERYAYICHQLKRPVRIDDKYDCRSITQLKHQLTPEKERFSPVKTEIIQEEITERKGKETKEKESEYIGENHQSFLKSLLMPESELDREKLAMLLGLRNTQALRPEWIEKFNAHLDFPEKKIHPSYQEWLKHLTNWLRKSITELQKQPAQLAGKKQDFF